MATLGRMEAPATLLGHFLAANGLAIERQAHLLIKSELDEHLSRRERRESIPKALPDLARLLLERGNDAPRLWGEAVRSHGRFALEQRHPMIDLVRQFGLLQVAIGAEWAATQGAMPVEVQALAADCLFEGAAAAASEYARRMRGQQVEFRESALIETIVNNLDEGILLVESDGVVSFATPLALELLGNPQELVGRRLDGGEGEGLWNDLEARVLSGEPVDASRLPFRKALQSGQRPEPLVIWLERGERARAVELNALPIWHDEAGEREPSRGALRGAIGTLRDRTIELRKSEDLEAAHREVAELHARMLQRSRSQAMGELARGAAHALNNLLNPLQLRMRRLHESRTPGDLELMEQGISDIAQLVARLQEFGGAPAAGKPEPVDLNTVVAEALTLVRPEGRRELSNHLRVEQRLDAATPIWANSAELRERLVMILLQLREDLAEGGVLELETQDESSGEGSWCRISCSGGGGALAAGELPSPLALTLGSAGETLARWGGSIDSRFDPDAISRIVLHLARARPLEMAPEVGTRTEAASPPRPAPAREVSRVLVIDDDVDNAEMLAEVLRDEGFQVATAGTGKQALATWKGADYTVALIDLLLPDMEGTEVARLFAAERPEARLALVTGWDLDERQRSSTPVTEVFRKPVDLERVIAFVGREAEPSPQPPLATPRLEDAAAPP